MGKIVLRLLYQRLPGIGSYYKCLTGKVSHAIAGYGSSRVSRPKCALLAPTYGWFTEGFDTA
jgi:hypothetical protein